MGEAAYRFVGTCTITYTQAYGVRDVRAHPITPHVHRYVIYKFHDQFIIVP